jgi:hypothetical protein
MPEGTGDIGTRVAGYMQQQTTATKEKQATAKQQKKAGRRELTGPKKAVVCLVALAVIGFALNFGYTSSRPPGVVRLLELREQQEAGKTVLVGKVKNTRSTALAQRAWSISYLDKDHKTAIPEFDLVIKDVQPGQTREFKIEVPGYQEGMQRVVKPKG